MEHPGLLRQLFLRVDLLCFRDRLYYRCLKSLNYSPFQISSQYFFKLHLIRFILFAKIPFYLCFLFAGVSGHAHKHWGSDFSTHAIAVRVLALFMMAISIGMAIYGAYNFKKRGDMLV